MKKWEGIEAVWHSGLAQIHREKSVSPLVRDGGPILPHSSSSLECSWEHQAEPYSASLALPLLLEPSQLVSARAGWSCSERGKISTLNLNQNITDLEEQLPGARKMNDLSKVVLTFARVILNTFFFSGWLDRLGMLIYVFPILFSIIWATVREFQSLKMCWAKLKGNMQKDGVLCCCRGAKWLVTILVGINYFSVWYGESALVPHIQWSCM